ncbi:MAG: radical SAM protein [Desulfobulbaceae bacterium]|nr:radical SAM protein [Desulfobulbaceae bacterium]
MRHQRPPASDFYSSERGTWKKDWRGRLPIALIFPSPYGVGMSNLGFQLVYDQINQHPDLVCERVFLPDPGTRALSVESSRPLADFPILLSALSFEQNLPDLVGMLLASGIEPLAARRCREKIGPGTPLIVAGGVACFINPEPLAPFVEAILIGEAEELLPPLLEKLLGGGERSAMLADLVGMPGCYVPQYYDFRYGENGILSEIKAREGAPERVRRLAWRGGEEAGYSRLLSPAAEFADLFLVELGRGCSRSCRFCAAGFVYRPPRLWTPEVINRALDQRPVGITRVGLLGMEMARTEDLQKVAERLLAEGCKLSFSSLRADALTPELLSLLAGSGLKSVAIAPDGGSERLRRVINKGISREAVLDAATRLVVAGIVNLKLYFMIGLPTETEEDLTEMVILVKEVREIMSIPGRARGRLANLTLSINPMVPKAWTPMQYHPFAEPNLLKKKLDFLQRGLRGMDNLKIMGEKPATAYLQATLARGDRRLAPALIEYAARGGNWQQVFRKCGVAPEAYALRERAAEELFPWEIIDQGMGKAYLWQEYRKALEARTSPVCEVGGCRRCGVCGGEEA